MTFRRLTALLAGLCALVPFSIGAQGRHMPDAVALKKLEKETTGAARVSTHEATGAVRNIRVRPGTSRLASGTAPNASQKHQKSMSFLREYRGLFGMTEPELELSLQSSETDALGETHLAYRQVYRGIPVFAAQMKTHFNPKHELKAVGGTFVPGIAVNASPSQAGDVAAAIARDAVAGQKPERADSLLAGTPSLVVFRAGLLQGVPGDAFLAWQVDVSNGVDVREHVFVDAHTGKILDQISGVHDAMNRRAYNGNFLPNVPHNYPNGAYWLEGQKFPTNSVEANNMIVTSKETYDLFWNAFGRDSWNNQGGTMDSIFNRGYSCPNASWNGVFISFCEGFTTDDVTGHEWGHAYTDSMHDLVYQWQSGALNESYSDIWGEIIDRINGHDQVAGDANPRTAGACSVHTPPVSTTRILSPASIAGDYPAQSASFGPRLSTTGVTAEVVAAIDPADALGLSTADGCSAFTNAADVAGKIALVNRGSCNFTVKVIHAQNAGAVAVIIANNGPAGMAPMGGADPAVTIPSVGMTQGDGNKIRGALVDGPVQVTLLSRPGTDDSTRWLMGEDITNAQLPGALRDMANPNCYGNPGRVSDVAYYHCTADDAGGVHLNSGIPNKAFTLLADGGAYNGRTVGAIGLTKAAHIYTRAATVYQVQDSNFADHADALEASCSDLVGQPLNALTGGPSNDVISANDCLQVSEAIAAVELRVSPTFCAFAPLLSQAASHVCMGGATAFSPIWNDTLDVNPTSTWTVSRINAFGATPRDWTWTSGLPGGRSGSAFFAPDPHIGTCLPGDDETALLSLDSPVINLPSSTNFTRLRFRHWLATEPGWDGGQLKISVNGGAWQTVQPADMAFNGYQALSFTAAQGNTNPLAGTAIWTGNDNGTVNGGTWGFSVVSLARFAQAGDQVQLRWDFGTDCAAGRTGWYVDDVEVASCVPVVPNVVSASGGILESNDAWNVAIPVQLTAATINPVQVSYSIVDGTATTGNDFLPVKSGVLTFPAGVRTATIVMTIKGDTVQEPNESFTVKLTGATNANIPANGHGLITIVNDDVTPPSP